MGISTKINNATFRVIVLFLLIHFNVDNIYSQFSLAPNGITIVCPGPSSGDTGVVDGVTYTAVDRTIRFCAMLGVVLCQILHRLHFA